MPAQPRLLWIPLAGGCTGTGLCFVAGTRVATPGGRRPIESLRVGDMVWAWSLQTHEPVARRVTATHRATSAALFRLQAGEHAIAGVTARHPIWDPDAEQWRPVEAMKDGDRCLVWPGADTPQALPVTISAAAGPAAVFNITVEGEESYFAEGVLVHNKTPADHWEIQVAITSPADGAALMEGAPLTLQGITDSDADGEMSVTWSVDGEPACDELVLSEPGEVSCEWTPATPGDATVRLSAVGLFALEEGEDTVDVTVLANEPPSIEIRAPAPDAVLPSGEPVAVEALLLDAEDGPDELSVVWSSDGQGELEVEGVIDSDGLFTGTISLSDGPHRLSATVTDTLGGTASDLVEVMVSDGG